MKSLWNQREKRPGIPLKQCLWHGAVQKHIWNDGKNRWWTWTCADPALITNSQQAFFRSNDYFSTKETCLEDLHAFCEDNEFVLHNKKAWPMNRMEFEDEQGANFEKESTTKEYISYHIDLTNEYSNLWNIWHFGNFFNYTNSDREKIEEKQKKMIKDGKFNRMKEIADELGFKFEIFDSHLLEKYEVEKCWIKLEVEHAVY